VSTSHPEPLCAQPSVTSTEVYGVYDGGLFYRCDQCKVTWHRWPEGHRLRAEAQKVMDRWATLRERRFRGGR